MPQIPLFGEDRRTAVHWSYSTDPLKPEAPAMFYVSVTGARQLAVEHGLTFCQLNVVHEVVSDLLIGSWESYLFGEPGDVRSIVASVSKNWKREAAIRPPW